MFGSLKKKLKKTIDKASEKFKKKKKPKEAEEPKESEEKPKKPKKPESKIKTRETKKPKEPKVEKKKSLEPKTKVKKKKKPKPKKKKSGILAKAGITEKELKEKDIEPVVKDLENTLLQNDVALETVDDISSNLKKELIGKRIRRGKTEKIITDAVKTSVLRVMKQDQIDLRKKIQNNDGPYTIVFLGFNGSGKTTTMAKIAHKYKEFNPVFAAGDTFRSAAIEQLEKHGKNLGVEVVKHDYGSDPAAVVYDAKKYGRKHDSGIVLADTAGRSHEDINLMDELKKIIRVNEPDLKLLVLDSLTGNDIYQQAKKFNEAVGVDGIILTKADVYDKGGAVLSAANTVGRPILYIGTGQDYDDIEEFNPEKIVDRLFSE